ncbi:Wall-associated receptor kinase 2-like [Abeliophyllum distichum]|uniref:Wall-associated receptor kinase 2-like n=1 Tax=Abeliophyllum distichum TaxID=126358 RepID=A0ABD1PRN6_9LAMI
MPWRKTTNPSNPTSPKRGKIPRMTTNSKRSSKENAMFVGNPDIKIRIVGTEKMKKIENKMNSLENDNIDATVSEINVVKEKAPGWWYDTCTTIHVCYDKSFFKSYQDVDDGQQIQMGNEG